MWVGRGVNFDDTFMCGGNWRVTDPGLALVQLADALARDWRPTFVRISLGMNSYTPVDWTGTYRTEMTNVIRAFGAHPNTYVMITLRSHPNMTLDCSASNDATCLPTTPTSMDSIYRALVDDFANDKFVVFAVANEPGGANSAALQTEVRAAMDHALQVIRAEEDLLRVPHHLVSVQGTQWTSLLGFYDAAPLAWDNVAYEYHSYPPTATGTYGYTQPHLPVIIGEYGPHTGSVTATEDWAGAAAFYADVEAKQIPNLAWDFAPFSDCGPDLLNTTTSTATSPVPVRWGQIVQAYLLAH